MTFSMKLRMFFRKPYNVILVLLFAALILLTFLPLLSIVLDTVTVHSSEVMRIRGSHAGDFTDYHWTKVLLDGTTSMSIFYKPLWNTVLISLSTCAIAIFFGGGMAWLITRTDIKYKPFLSALFVVPYIMPSWTLALAWLNFFRNSLVGGVPGLFTVLTGIPTPNWFAYGFFPISIVQGLHYAPFAYILIGGILKHMDASLEEAAQLLHASRWQIMKRITLPMVKPALLSTFLLAFSSSMSAFAVPAFLGAPVRLPRADDAALSHTAGAESWLWLCDGADSHPDRCRYHDGEPESVEWKEILYHHHRQERQCLAHPVSRSAPTDFSPACSSPRVRDCRPAHHLCGRVFHR